MYLPYIRGKQFELIGLRELSNNVLFSNKNKIYPIIEPVKDSSTLKTALREFIAKGINFTVIINPQVGEFRDTVEILEVIRALVGRYTNFQIGVIFYAQLNHNSLLTILNRYTDIIHSFSIIHNSAFDNLTQILNQYAAIADIRFNIINFDKLPQRYTANFPGNTLVGLRDHFKSQSKNADYLDIDESDFSEEHLHYISEGFVGFSDFLTFGDSYSDSGYAPYAVAIHISFSNVNNAIKVKHFVSDSNNDTSDVAGKFDEALIKLATWCDMTNYNSIAIPVFRDYHARRHYPGLGTAKKLSLMNHIDLVSRLI